MLWIGIWCTLTLLAKLTQIWVIWGLWGKQWRNDMVEAVQLHSLLLHIHIVYMESVWACSYAVDRHMGAPLHCYTAGHQVGPDLGNVGMMGWNSDLLTYILYIESVWACSYAVDRHMGAPLHCYTAGHQVDPDLGNVGMVSWNNDALRWLRLYSSPHPYFIDGKRLSMFICCG
jgi:hypothetical protein